MSKGRSEARDRYRDEMFVADDGGDTPAWCSAWDGRNAAEAVALVNSALGPFPTSVTAELVHGYVTDEGALGLRFHKDESGDALFWEVNGE